MIQFLFGNITKWQNWLLASAFALYLPICMKFMKFIALQQEVRTYPNNLIYGVRLQEKVGDWL